jgi:hypothetical protein
MAKLINIRNTCLQQPIMAPMEAPKQVPQHSKVPSSGTHEVARLAESHSSYESCSGSAKLILLDYSQGKVSRTMVAYIVEMFCQ